MGWTHRQFHKKRTSKWLEKQTASRDSLRNSWRQYCIWPLRPPCLHHRPYRKGEGICKIRTEEHFRRHYGVKRYYSSGTNDNVQRWHQRIATTTHQPQDMGNLKGIFTLRIQIETEISHHRRKRGLHRSGTEHLQCNTPPRYKRIVKQ